MHDAALLAVQAHWGVNRKHSQLPYAVHPFEVAKILSRWGVERETLLAAAMLHDTVEDTDVTDADLREQFGDEVATIVQYVTWPDGVKTQRHKFDHLLEWVMTASPVDDLVHDALLLKLADRAANVKDFYDQDPIYAAHYLLTGFPAFYGYLRRFADHRHSVVDVPAFENTRGWLEILTRDHFRGPDGRPSDKLRFLWQTVTPESVRALLWPPKSRKS